MPDRIFRVVALACATLCWSDRACGQLPATSALSGRITNSSAVTFSVKLTPVRKDPLALYDGYSTQTASSGAFVFEDIEPGRYVLSAEGAGFVPKAVQNGAPIELRPGQHRKGVVITLSPRHVVCGKVTDERGNPLRGVEVYAFVHAKQSMWLGGGTYARTDEEGSYRIPDLQVGEYFGQAGMSTWFPGAANFTQSQAESLANAWPVEIGPDESGGCRENISMTPRLGYRGFHIRGEIAEHPALAGKDLILSLLDVHRTGVARVVPPTETFNPGRSFDLWGVPAGRYRLILSKGRFVANGSRDQPSFIILSSQEITVADSDVNGITVARDTLASLSGQMRLQDVTAAKACPTQEKTHIRIQRDDDGQFQDVEMAADGTFSFPYVPPGIYTVRGYPFRRGTVYVKSMLLDGRPAQSGKLRIDSPGAHAVEIVLSGDKANATGHTTPDKLTERFEAQWAHPKASLSGKIVNLVDGNSPWVKLWAVRFNSDRSYEYSTKPDPDGNFRFDNVDPGIYLLLSQGRGYTLSEYGASHPGLEGTAVTLRAGEHLEGLTWSASPKRPCVCGRVTDEDGRTLPNVPVFAWFQSKAKGYMVLPGVSTDSAVPHPEIYVREQADADESRPPASIFTEFTQKCRYSPDCRTGCLMPRLTANSTRHTDKGEFLGNEGQGIHPPLY
jgi:protocatechuate 3,4-dioxygenase beta subunit